MNSKQLLQGQREGKRRFYLAGVSVALIAIAITWLLDQLNSAESFLEPYFYPVAAVGLAILALLAWRSKRLRRFEYGLFLLIALLLESGLFETMQASPLNALEINNLLFWFLIAQLFAFLAFRAPRDIYVLGAFVIITLLVALSHFQAHPAALGESTELTILLRFVLSNVVFLAISSFIFRSKDEKTRLHAASGIRKEIATTDRVTQLKNRSAYEEELDRELYRIRRYGLQSSLLLLKIHGLEKIKKEFGVGNMNKVLLSIAQTTRELLRESDFLARFHTDQFAIILPETDPDSAEATSVRIRNNLTKMVILPVTFPSVNIRVIQLTELMEKEDVLATMKGGVQESEDSWTEADLELSS